MNTKPLYIGRAIRIARLKDTASVIGNLLLLWAIMAMVIFGHAFID